MFVGTGGVLMYWLAGGGYLDVGGHWVVFYVLLG